METKDLLLENELKEEINLLIVEELTVNDDVLEETQKVEEYITKNIQLIAPIDFANGGGKREMSFSMNMFDNNIKVNFSVVNYNFRDKQYFNEYNKKYSIDMESKSVYNMIGNTPFCLCIINYISIGFKPLAKFHEDVYHELNHLFQQYKQGHTYSDSLKYAHIPTSIYSDNEIEHNSAEIIYLANHYEQDSFVSSVYNFVKNKFYTNVKNRQTIDDLLKETDAYNKIYRLKELFKLIQKNKEEYCNAILKQYGFKQWDRFDKYVRNSIHRFEKKFAMCVKKCKKDFLIYETHTWCEGTDYNFYYKLL